MEKTHRLNGEDVRFKVSAAVPFLYKKHFGRDMFKDLFRLGKTGNTFIRDDNQEISYDDISYEAIEHIELDIMYELAWLFAKHADDTIPDMIDWLGKYDLTIGQVSAIVSPLIKGLMKQKKPPAAQKTKQHKKKHSKKQKKH